MLKLSTSTLNMPTTRVKSSNGKPYTYSCCSIVVPHFPLCCVHCRSGFFLGALSSNMEDNDASRTSSAGSGGGTVEQPQQDQPGQLPSADTGTAQPAATPAPQPKRRQPGAQRDLELPTDFDGVKTATMWLELCAADIGTATGVVARLDGIEAANAVKDGLNQNIEQLKASMKELRENVSIGLNDQEKWRTVLQLRALLMRKRKLWTWNCLGTRARELYAAALVSPLRVSEAGCQAHP